MPSCDWMYGDCASGALGIQALAPFNPMRWSGSRSLENAILDMQMVIAEGSRPIILKIPASSLSKEVYFETPEDAIEYIRSKDPSHQAKLREEELAAATKEEARRIKDEQVKKLQKEAEEQRVRVSEWEQICEKAFFAVTKAETAKKKALAAAPDTTTGVTFEWMFNDLLFNALAHLNRFRWSGHRSCGQAKDELEEAVDNYKSENKPERPITLKIHKEGKQEQKDFPDTTAAIQFLVENMPNAEEKELGELEAAYLKAKSESEHANEKLEEAKAEAQQAHEASEAALLEANEAQQE